MRMRIQTWYRVATKPIQSWYRTCRAGRWKNRDMGTATWIKKLFLKTKDNKLIFVWKILLNLPTFFWQVCLEFVSAFTFACDGILVRCLISMVHFDGTHWRCSGLVQQFCTYLRTLLHTPLISVSYPLALGRKVNLPANLPTNLLKSVC